ncbi:MAG TPA: hypothetical protein PKU93_02270 [Candidatus Pacearchaeota archaeon]|nr:hypothetical protein [Candidatus Pacearchaeota archaeon]
MAKQQKNITIGGITSDGTILNEENWKKEQAMKKISRNENIKEISKANDVPVY